jgi:hypothetical protein
VLVAISPTDILGLAAIIAVCVGMLYLASRIEPHWVSKDDSRFLSTAQELDQWGTAFGRRHEVRVNIDPDDNVLHLSRRSMLRPTSGVWTISAKVPTPPRGRVIYLLKRVGEAPPTKSRLGGRSATVEPDTGQMALRLPAKSRVVPILDAMLDGTPRPGQDPHDDPHHDPMDEGLTDG